MITNKHRFRGMLVAMATAVLATACGTASAPPPIAAFDSATKDDTAFNQQFRHEFADVDGMRMHYVTGGSGPALVLLHGWPQSWYEWRDVMPALAAHYTVYAVDLPGLGDSDGAPASYDKATLARYVHGLIGDQLGQRAIRLVAHDLGAGVGFQYAARYPGEVVRYAHLDYPLPGPGLSAAQYRNLSWHIAFNQQPLIPEAVVHDDVRDYLALFYPQVAFGGSAFGGSRTTAPFADAEIDEYARTYARPQVLHGGFELYRTLGQDELDNTAAAPITVPTMLMTAQGSLAAFRAINGPRMANLTRTVEVPQAGHWLVEENPAFVTTELLDFLAG